MKQEYWDWNVDHGMRLILERFMQLVDRNGPAIYIGLGQQGSDFRKITFKGFVLLFILDPITKVIYIRIRKVLPIAVNSSNRAFKNC